MYSVYGYNVAIVILLHLSGSSVLMIRAKNCLDIFNSMTLPFINLSGQIRANVENV